MGRPWDSVGMGRGVAPPLRAAAALRPAGSSTGIDQLIIRSGHPASGQIQSKDGPRQWPRVVSRCPISEKAQWQCRRRPIGNDLGARSAMIRWCPMEAATSISIKFKIGSPNNPHARGRGPHRTRSALQRIRQAGRPAIADRLYRLMPGLRIDRLPHAVATAILMQAEYSA